ncbi:CGNR zinc finger domain-containing protein [Dactylosporangium sp. NPDC049742]|uniref:CGNR zinc finger domain-containing protein n=1 Tax=Dactylosporangium sp. NPDC049742 TaxID=3154737 RepID=UPI00341D90C1
MKPQEAPGALEIVRSFANTLDLEHGTDQLADAAGLAAWCRQHLPEVSHPALSEAVALRTALRDAIDGDPAALDAIAAAQPLRLRLGGQSARLTAGEDATDPLAARLLAVVAVAAFDGTWERLKLCPAEDCRWAFYDHARNRKGVWCQMSECGNRRKVRDFRARRRADLTP